MPHSGGPPQLMVLFGRRFETIIEKSVNSFIYCLWDHLSHCTVCCGEPFRRLWWSLRCRSWFKKSSKIFLPFFNPSFFACFWVTSRQRTTTRLSRGRSWTLRTRVRTRTGPKGPGPGPDVEWTGPRVRSRSGPGPTLHVTVPQKCFKTSPKSY